MSDFSYASLYCLYIRFAAQPHHELKDADLEVPRCWENFQQIQLFTDRSRTINRCKQRNFVIAAEIQFFIAYFARWKGHVP